MSTIFVTATDTDAGKTYVTCAAVRQYLDLGLDAIALKPIACGAHEERYADIDRLLAAQGLDHPDQINLYRFPLAAAPAHATPAGQAIDPSKLDAWCRKHAQRHACTLIEGIGGLRVPLRTGYEVRDWIRDCRPDHLWLIVRCRIGALNHLLLTLESLQAIGRQPDHIVLNALRKEDEAYLPALAEGCATVAGSGKILTLGCGETLDARALLPGGGRRGETQA